MKQESRWIPFFTLYDREVKRFLKVSVQTLFSPLVSAGLYLLIFGVSLGGNIQLDHDVNYLAFLIPGLVMMAVLNNAFQNSSSSIVSGKFTGDLEDWKVAPLKETEILGALALGGLTRGLAVGLVTFATGEVFYFLMHGAFIPIAAPFWLVTFLIFGGTSFALFGVCVAFWARTFDQLSAINSFILLPLIYLGGVFFSVEGLHPFWRTISHLNPLFYLINGVRYGILGFGDVNVYMAFVVSIFSFVLFYVLAYWSLIKGSYGRW